MASRILYHKKIHVCFAVLTLILCIDPMSANAQETWTIDQYLEYSREENVLPFSQNLNFLNNKVKGMPLVDNLEFRTETNEMELERQQFQFRFEFNSRDERKAYDKILEVNKEKYLWLQAKHKLGIKEERYQNIIDIHFLQKEIELLNDEFEFLYDKRKVLKKLMKSNSSIEVEDWIANENEIYELKADSLELELQKREMAINVFGVERTLPNLESSDLLEVSELQGEWLKLKDGKFLHPDNALVDLRKDMADAEYKLEVAEANKWFNFAQLEYQADDRVSFQRELSFSTSIIIPYKNNNRVKKNDATLELMERSYQSQLEKEESTNDLIKEEAKFSDLIGQLEEFKKLNANQDLAGIYENYASQQLVSPLVLIGIRRSMLKQEKKQLNLEKDIYEVYLNLLSMSAAFINNENRNYLTE